MKRHSNSKQKQTRRDFTKSVAATLACSPIVAFADTKCKKERKYVTTGMPQKLCGCDYVPHLERTEHIPPVGVSGGSLQINIKHILTPKEGSAEHPYKYVIEKQNLPRAEQYGSIAMIWVITEVLRGNKGSFYDYYYTFPKAYNAQLRLWLQDILKDDGSEMQRLPNTPHVVIKGGAVVDGQKSLSIEIDQPINAKASNSPMRPRKYKHKGHAKEFRIGKWDIVDGNGRPSGFSETGLDDYKFMILFYEP
ncbi:MAG TPA: hypothetical protein VF131_00385 [Blastocatellia bacterium]|nr:hypothetical protein [Blastocatellia bacterium]